MSKFTVGEYTMRNGKKAVVLGEVPDCTEVGKCMLVGYLPWDGLNRVKSWSMEGRAWGAMDSDLDLMPPKRKIEQWIFSWYNPKARRSMPSYGVRTRSTLGEAEEERKFCEELGYICSEIVQAPTLEVEVDE